jgi:HK97 family phage portal protein
MAAPGLTRRWLMAAAAQLGLVRQSGNGLRWVWPSTGGDRGPPGTWQQSAYAQNQIDTELVAFSAVYACTSIISCDIAKLPIQVFKIDQKTGGRVVQRTDYYAGLFRTPNGYQTHADFIQLYVLSYLLQGNAYAYVRRNGRGEITEMHVLDPRFVQPWIVPDTGDVFYRVGTNRLAGLMGGAVIPERDIIHHRLPLLPGYPLIGVTPIFAAAASSAVGLKILSNSQKFFSNSSRPAGVLQAPGKVSKETAERLAQDWDNNYSGERFGKTAVLPEGLTWEPLTITAQDAQLIEQLRWSVEDVGRVFRVPPFMLGDITKVTYRNSEQLARAYLTGCLSYHIEALEERFERAFEFPADYEIKFDLSALLRTEIDVRYTAYTQSLNAGWQTINEVRANEGLEPVDGGDEPHLQMQYVPLSKINDPPAPAPNPLLPAGTPKPGEEPPPAPDDSDPDTEASKSIDRARVRALLRQRLDRRAA